ncbi:MAG: chemotaxis protein CheW [Proteobacteria bacterium]|nr:chemotaxis protein CheW [Pseudomonadota bacterium]
MPATAPAPVRRALTFVAGGQVLALAAQDVAEVLAVPEITRVPLSPPGLRGLANVRGRVTPILDLGLLLGAGAGAEPKQIVVLEGGDPVAFPVECIVGLAEVSSEAETPPWLDVEPLLAEALAAGRSRRGKGATARAGSAPSGWTPSVEAAPEAFLRFGLGGQAYALPLEQVTEVMSVPEQIVALPRSEAAMLGAAPVRGGVLPVVSLRVLLGLASQPATTASRLVVTEVGVGRIALLVDEVHDVLRAPASDIGPVPDLLNRGVGEAQIDRLIRSSQGLVSVLVAERLFAAETFEALATGESPQGETPEAATDGAALPFLSFRLGSETYGLPAENVVEIVRAPDSPARPPHAPSFLVGLMNHRGAVVPLIDQRRRFGASAKPGAARQVVVVQLGEVVAGLLVDEVDQIVQAPRDTLAAAAGMMAGDATVFDRVVLHGPGGRLLLIVDPRALLDQAERDLLAAITADGALGAA